MLNSEPARRRRYTSTTAVGSGASATGHQPNTATALTVADLPPDCQARSLAIREALNALGTNANAATLIRVAEWIINGKETEQ